MTLRRLILDFTGDGIQLRAAYRTQSRSGPGTKARAREVEDLARGGLRRALEALEGEVEMVGTAGFETREDTLAAEASPLNAKRQGGG